MRSAKRHASRTLQRVRRAIASGLVSDAPDELVVPVLDAAVALARTADPSGTQLDRAEAAISALERWGDRSALPAYRPNEYARGWMRILNTAHRAQ